MCVRLQRKNWWNIRKGKSLWYPGRAQLHGDGSRAERAWSSRSRLIMTWNNWRSLTPRRSFSRDHPLFLFAWLAQYIAHSLIYVICRISRDQARIADSLLIKRLIARLLCSFHLISRFPIGFKIVLILWAQNFLIDINCKEWGFLVNIKSLERLSIKFTANGKRETVDSGVSQKRENIRFSTCVTLLRSYSIFLVNRQERSLIKSSFSVFWQKGNFILPFAVNVMLKLSIFRYNDSIVADPKLLG